MKNVETTLAEIAKKNLSLETLATRYSDDLDFHDLSVWQLRAALEEAFKAGQASVKGGAK